MVAAAVVVVTGVWNRVGRTCGSLFGCFIGLAWSLMTQGRFFILRVICIPFCHVPPSYIMPLELHGQITALLYL